MKMIETERTDGQVQEAEKRETNRFFLNIEEGRIKSGKKRGKTLGLLIFAGTTEGRELAEFLARRGVGCHICVATEYGAQILERELLDHQVHQGRLNAEEMEQLIRAEKIRLVVDATHPYASVVTREIQAACQAAECRYLRLLREKEEIKDSCVFVDTVREAAEYLKDTRGNILAATGSKELKEYTAIPEYETRVYARVLPSLEAVESCRKLGFSGKNVICMQGPFGEELNYGMLKQIQGRYLVTKESGKTGGFQEKLQAAKRAGAKLIVVGRPVQEIGADKWETRRILCQEFGISGNPEIVLAGIGMGNSMNVTREVWQACREADMLFGAGRMLETVAELGKPQKEAYLSEDIQKYLLEHPEYERIVILLSGDVGFYSGAKKLQEALGPDRCRVLNGISSVVYLCGRLGTSWEDAKLVSIHGRSQNLVGAVQRHKKVFALAGKQESFWSLCRELVDYGLGQVKMQVGCHLSYPEEQILCGTPETLQNAKVGDLTAALLENEAPFTTVTHGMEDECFLRDQVPMTKSEIRSISLSKLELEKDSVIYDVGAGTGSVSIEMALQASEGTVYAVEKKAEALALIEKNKKKFGTANLRLVGGLAPQALEDLPVPTHAFIGGSSGNLKEIMELLLEKNPGVRMVINAISLETVAEALSCIKTLPVIRQEVVSVNVSRSRKLAGYHMMMGQNPVYIISCTGKGPKED